MKIHDKNLSAALLSGLRAVAAVVCLLLCAGLWTPSWGQRGGREITGTVVDENNLPMPGDRHGGWYSKRHDDNRCRYLRPR